MNKTIKKAWVKALRSGEYKQGRGVLRDIEDNFCCLGVLCDIALDDWWVFHEENTDLIRDDSGECVGYYDLQSSGRSALLPDDFREKVGISVAKQTALTMMNDAGSWKTGIPMSFTEIADWIEVNL